MLKENTGRGKKVLVVVGPTASGKTVLSLILAKKYNGEIISADSRQVYRGMDIGTAKALRMQNVNLKTESDNEKLKNRRDYYSGGIRHHLIDIRNLGEDYTVAEFKEDAIKSIKKVLNKDKPPIVVGGTAQYIYALVDNWQIPAVKENKKLRAKIEKEIAEKGLGAVYEKLLDLDPEAAYVVDPKNPRRVIRALEVALITGQPFTKQRRAGQPLFDFLLIGIKLPPEKLKERITKRTRNMLKAGLVGEVEGLVKKYGRNQRAFNTIGYREIIDYLDGKTTLKEAEQKIVINTHHFARRQMQWFRRDERIHWVSASAFPVTRKLLADWLCLW